MPRWTFIIAITLFVATTSHVQARSAPSCDFYDLVRDKIVVAKKGIAEKEKTEAKTESIAGKKVEPIAKLVIEPVREKVVENSPLRVAPEERVQAPAEIGFKNLEKPAGWIELLRPEVVREPVRTELREPARAELREPRRTEVREPSRTETRDQTEIGLAHEGVHEHHLSTEAIPRLVEKLARAVEVRRTPDGLVHYVRREGREADVARAEIVRDLGPELPRVIREERGTPLPTEAHNPFNGVPVRSVGGLLAVATGKPGPEGTVRIPTERGPEVVLKGDSDALVATTLNGLEEVRPPTTGATALAPNPVIPLAGNPARGGEPVRTAATEPARDGGSSNTAPQNGTTAATTPNQGTTPSRGVTPPRNPTSTVNTGNSGNPSAPRAPVKTAGGNGASKADVAKTRPNPPPPPKVAEQHRGGEGQPAPLASANSGDKEGSRGVRRRFDSLAQNERGGGGGSANQLISGGSEITAPPRRPARVAPQALPFNSAPRETLNRRPRAAQPYMPANSFNEVASRSEEANSRAEAAAQRNNGGQAPAPEAAPPPQPQQLAASEAAYSGFSNSGYSKSAPTEVAKVAAVQAEAPPPAVSAAQQAVVAEPETRPIGPTTSSIDTVVATDEARRPTKTVTIVRDIETGTGIQVKKTEKETRLNPDTQQATSVKETTTEFDPASRHSKKITIVESELDPASKKATKTTETIREFDQKSFVETKVTKTVSEMDPTTGKAKVRVQTIKLLDAATHNATKVTIITSELDAQTQRMTKRTTTTLEYEPVGQKLISKTTRIQYGDRITSGAEVAKASAPL